MPPESLTAPAFASEIHRGAVEGGPVWYKDAVIYQVHVRAFADSSGDGVGDFPGLTSKLDYLQDLGVTALWLLPFYPSPLKDDGYDIADYTSVHPSYGTLRDFKAFLRDAHVRGLRVITELVLNHTSDQHPWFKRARRAKPGSSARDFYVWSDTADKYKEARIIFKDFEASNWTWDPVAKAYYWHRFYSHQPDLNFENPQVRKALLETVSFWLEMGVDGMRLDAVPYLFECEGTNCENLPETHAFLKELRRYVDARFSDRMLLAEANQWPEDAIAYFGDGDECHTAFNFPVMPRLFMAKHMEDRFPIVDILQQTPPIPANCQWVLFLRNHDELTLEMVTDEERDYMYRVYAHDPQARINLGIRRRLAPLLNNNRRTIELLQGLLFSLPGTPVIYYGDEVGMGDNIYLGDRDGVRTPMQWSSDRNAGFSRANPQKLYLPVVIDPEYLYETVNVETQRNNPQSLWWWMKRLIAVRNQHPAFGRGSLELLLPENAKVLAFVRQLDDDQVLVVANLSRFSQYVELDLSAYEGRVPVELFGHNRFPTIGKLPYLLTLGPHAFYWFALAPSEITPTDGKLSMQSDGKPEDRLPRANVHAHWAEIFQGRAKTQLEASLRGWLCGQRWFSGKARTIQNVTITNAVLLGNSPADPLARYLALAQVDYTDGEPEIYLLPLGFVAGDALESFLAAAPKSAILRVHLRDTKQAGVVFDATSDAAFAAALWDTLDRRRRWKSQTGELTVSHLPTLRTFLPADMGALPAVVVKGEQSNTSIIYGDKAILKLFRGIKPGVNPDLEIGRFFVEHGNFPHTPPLLSALEYETEGSEPLTLAVLNVFVPQTETAWQFALDNLSRYFEQVLTLPMERWPRSEGLGNQSLWEIAAVPSPAPIQELASGFLHAATLLGQRTAEMHKALASDPETPTFAPEVFSQLYQRSLYQSARKSAVQNLQRLKKRLSHLSPRAQQLGRQVLDQEKHVLDQLKSITSGRIVAERIRCHGDYHLGQVLYTGKDFVIIDFEGEPLRSFSERRIKCSPLQDVASMIRSFHYAAAQGFNHVAVAGLHTPETTEPLKHAGTAWAISIVGTFLQAYQTTIGNAAFFPPAAKDRELLLNFYLLQKAIYEMGYELNNRPDWVEIPLAAIIYLLGGKP
ncbi:MAG TPA: maltose alpha-D-glucosyltransferase [Pirellulales bacterium]|jgi:maltose alpha-D-glucosyltransferase/alpha-amylase|nr:maltose alpha-D-glucosyltransferase [Pirellulales bacterium]